MNTLPIVLLILGIIACAEHVETSKNDDAFINSADNERLKSSLQGTWKMVSAKHITQGDTVERYAIDKLEGIKIIGATHFSFFQHDLRRGTDSSNYFSSGAGKYVLDGDRYIEFLEYCSGRDWEGNRFEFDVQVKNDTLIQTGKESLPDLGVDRVIVETYVRADNGNTPIPVMNEFKEEEITWFSKTGTGTIEGIAKFRSKEGEIHFGEQFRIELMPMSGYTEERLSKIYDNSDSGVVYIADGVPRFIPDPELYHKTIITPCDAEGKFEFSELPEGEYYAIAFMIWDEPNDQMSQKGGGIMRKVKVAENQVAEIKMTNF